MLPGHLLMLHIQYSNPRTCCLAFCARPCLWFCVCGFTDVPSFTAQFVVQKDKTDFANALDPGTLLCSRSGDASFHLTRSSALAMCHCQVKFVENHAAVSDATAAFVRFTIAAASMLPFADWGEKEVLFAGEIVCSSCVPGACYDNSYSCCTRHVLARWHSVLLVHGAPKVPLLEYRELCRLVGCAGSAERERDAWQVMLLGQSVRELRSLTIVAAMGGNLLFGRRSRTRRGTRADSFAIRL